MGKGAEEEKALLDYYYSVKLGEGEEVKKWSANSGHDVSLRPKDNFIGWKETLGETII